MRGDDNGNEAQKETGQEKETQAKEKLLIATVTNIYPYNGKHRLSVSCEGKAKGYEYEDKAEARKARARLVRRLKMDGLTVHMRRVN